MPLAIKVEPESLVSRDIIAWLKKMASNSPLGDFIEVGVYKGGTAWHLGEVAREQDRQLYLCDTFSGIPYASAVHGDRHKPGDFADVSLTEVMAAIPDAEYIVGVFPEAAGVRLDHVQFAFAHIDCDQYQSIMETVSALRPKMVSGGVMVFDDYEFLGGAKKAVDEAFGDALRKDGKRPYVRF